MTHRHYLALALTTCLAGGCGDDGSASDSTDTGAASTAGAGGATGTASSSAAGGSGGGGGRPAERPLPPPSRIDPMPERVVAIGDLHGDFDAMMRALRIGGLVDAGGQWVGGETVAVQTGDQLDRGDDDRAILDYLEQLADEAWAAGGALYVLNGNHETLNVELDFRYVTPAALDAFADLDPGGSDPVLDALAAEERGRGAAFRPGGVYARLLAEHNSMMQIGDTVFVHGGILPAHVDAGLLTMNESIRAWMLGEVATADEPYIGEDGPLWVRNYSDGTTPLDCELLGEALALLGAQRMVVAHTVQDSINAECDGKVWRIDVGMSAYYGGIAAALEIVGGEVRVLE